MDERGGRELGRRPKREHKPERTERPMTFTFTLWQISKGMVLYVSTELLYLLS